MQEAGLDGHGSAADLAIHNELGRFITIQLALEVLLAMRAGDGDEGSHAADSMDLSQNATWLGFLAGLFNESDQSQPVSKLPLSAAQPESCSWNSVAW